MPVVTHGRDEQRAELPVPDALDAVLARMTRRVDDLRQRGDDRRIFLAVYATMTGAIHDGVRGGRFMDPAWTEVLTARFATL
jgi:hypothetical protein